MIRMRAVAAAAAATATEAAAAAAARSSRSSAVAAAAAAASRRTAEAAAAAAASRRTGEAAAAAARIMAAHLQSPLHWKRRPKCGPSQPSPLKCGPVNCEYSYQTICWSSSFSALLPSSSVLLTLTLAFQIFGSDYEYDRQPNISPDMEKR